MSSRTPVGASNRAELFSARGDQYDLDKKADDIYDTAEERENDDSLLQLEHMIGYAGDFRGTVVASASDENIYIRR